MTQTSATQANQPTLRKLKAFALMYVCVNAAAFAAIIALRHKTGQVNDTVWIRGTILFATSLLLFAFTNHITRGSRKALLRVRIIATILLASVIVLLVVGHQLLPLWMKLEQAVCGLLLLGIVILVNGKPIRSHTS